METGSHFVSRRSGSLLEVGGMALRGRLARKHMQMLRNTDMYAPIAEMRISFDASCQVIGTADSVCGYAFNKGVW